MSVPTELREEEIEERLEKLDDWERIDETISRTFEFTHFQEAFSFLTRVALLAEKNDHHPEIWNVWNKVKLSLTTHDAKGLTEKDFDLAERIDEMCWI